MKPAGHFVTAAAELAARVQNRQDDLCRAQVFEFGVLVDRNAAAVICDLAAAILEDRDEDFGTKARHCFVDGIVHHLVHKVMQAGRSGGTDVHAGPLSHCLQAFKDLNLLSTVRS